jgi:hypothetical protein
LSAVSADRKSTRVLLALLLTAVAAQGVFFALYLIPWDDESGYLVLGALAARGEIRLFQDEMLGERLPIPFYVLGASQLLVGPSLLLARLTSLALGVSALLLVYSVGARVAGPLGGTLSAIFLATQSMVVAYYATAMYHAFCSLTIAAGLYFLFVTGSRVWAMAAFSVLSLARPNLAVMVPFVLGALLFVATSARERSALIAIAVLPPVVFFASNPEHLKILAYVPVLDRFVRPLGYESLFNLGGRALAEAGERGWWWSLAWFLRRYIFWCAAGFGLVACAILARWRAGVAGVTISWPLRFVGALLAWTLLWQALILRHYPKSVAAWSASFAPLAAILLGCGAARLLARGETGPWLHRAITAGLVTTFLVSPRYSTHASMPEPLPEKPTVVAMNHLATEIRAHIPPGTRVFLLGQSLPIYLAGSRPYLQQMIHIWTLVPDGAPSVLHRSGLWGRADIEAWLGSEARFAVITLAQLDFLRGVHDYKALAGSITQALEDHFQTVADVDIPPLGRYRVYQRRERSQ